SPRCSREGRPLLRRPGPADARGVDAPAEADDPARRPADPVAHHEVLLELRLPRLRALPRLQGRGDQAVLPRLQRGAHERLRPPRRRQDGRAPRQRHPRLVDDLREYGAQLDDRRADEGGRAVSRGRGGLPRDLRRRPHRRAAPRHDRHAHGERQDGALPVRATDAPVPRRVAPGRERCRGDPRRRRRRPLDQRRLLRLPAGDPRPSRPRRGPRRSRVPPPDRRGQSDRVSVQGLLGADGHPEGQADPRDAARVGRAALGEPARPRAAGRDADRLMLTASLDLEHGPARVLAIGCHADDIEIGCGGTLLALAERRPDVEVTWLVLSANGARGEEARASAEAFLSGLETPPRVLLETFRDGFFPYLGGAVKDRFEALKGEVSPELVFTHVGIDLHQDHRLVSELTWNTFRDHLILEYEIPKYDADLTAPNVYVPLGPDVLQRKVDLLLEHFPSQRGKHWFTEDLFRSLARV